MAQDGARLTEAQQNQVPPTLRRWVAETARGVERIDRFGNGNECNRRGWTIKAQSVELGVLPEGYEAGNVYVCGGIVHAQVREQ
jgi:hypothetical protein